jgi:hypothetical protein
MADALIATIELQGLKKTLTESPPDPTMPEAKATNLSIQPEEKLTKTVQLDLSDPSRVTHIGNSLDPKLELTLIKFLQENRDIFVWKPADMPRVPRELIDHELHIEPNAKPIKQCLHHFAQDKKDVIKKELARLLDSGSIHDLYHPDWLANPVLVSKKKKEWWMCVNYTNLYHTCKKILLAWPELLKSWIQRQKVVCYASWIATRGLIRSPTKLKIKSRWGHSVHFATPPCPISSKA